MVVQNGCECTENCFCQENDQQNNFNILKKKKAKVGILLLKSHCSFGWEMVGDDDLKSWENVGNLQIPEVWEP